jgi:hypothetical protein
LGVSPTVAVEGDETVTPAFLTRILRARRLLKPIPVIVETVAEPIGAQGFPAWIAPVARWKPDGKRKAQTFPPPLGVEPAAAVEVPFAATVGKRLRKRQSRQGLFLSSGGGIAATPFVPFIPRLPLPRYRKTERRLLSASLVIDSQPYVPAGDQGFPAWIAPKVKWKADARRRVQTFPRPLGVDPAPPVVVVDTPPQGAGKPKRRHRYTIVIDGQEFEVSSYEQAVELLDRAKAAAPALAQATAKRVEKRIRRKGKAPATIDTPVISTPDSALTEIVARYREQIRGIYVDAAQNAELRALLRKKFADEDEDDIEVLLLH